MKNKKISVRLPNNRLVVGVLLIMISFLLIQIKLPTNSCNSDKYDLDNLTVETVRAPNTTTSTETTMGMGPMKFLPLAVVTDKGCSGSTAVGHFFEKIIAAHGLKRYNELAFECMNVKEKWKNPVYHRLASKPEYADSTHDEILLDSIKVAKENAEKLGQIFYFKVGTKHAEGKWRENLENLGVAYVGMYRENVLDRCICTTKDCLGDAAGYPVFQNNGTRTDLCIARRFTNESIQAHFVDPTSCFDRSLDQQRKIRNQDFPTVSEESLFEFEYTDSDKTFRSSINQWRKLLRPFLTAALDRSKIRDALEEYRGSRSMPLPHKELVFNYDYLVNEIKSTIWEKYLRILQ